MPAIGVDTGPMPRRRPPSQLGSGAKPRLRDLLVAYFARNDEILSIPDICLKFNVSRATAQQSVFHMRTCGLLDVVQESQGGSPMFVGRGPELLE